MSVLSAQSIRARCVLLNTVGSNVHGRPMVEPFHRRTEVFCCEGRWVLATKHTVETQQQIEGKPPKLFSYGLSTCGYDVRIAQDIWLWPGFGRLASTIERFNMPADVMAEVKDKSSWARRFVTVQNTVIEPGWRGTLTLELTNHRPWPRFIRAGSPIAQIVFYNLDKASEQPYNGKYQDQEPGPQPAR